MNNKLKYVKKDLLNQALRKIEYIYIFNFTYKFLLSKYLIYQNFEPGAVVVLKLL